MGYQADVGTVFGLARLYHICHIQLKYCTSYYKQTKEYVILGRVFTKKKL